MGWLTDAIDYLGNGTNWQGSGGLGARLVEHIWLSFLALFIALAIAVPVGLYIGHVGRGGNLAIQIGNVGRSVPTFAAIAILFLLPKPFGPTTVSVIIALVLFCIPPVLTNTYVGMREVNRDLVDAARGMGMSGGQTLHQVELPLALPLILSGVRLAAVQAVATAAIAGLFGGGGLGRVITAGFAQQNQPKLIAGAVVVTVLAIVVEVAFAVLQRQWDPVGRARRSTGHRAGREVTLPDEDSAMASVTS